MVNRSLFRGACIRGFDSLHPFLSAKNTRFNNSPSRYPFPGRCESRTRLATI